MDAEVSQGVSQGASPGASRGAWSSVLAAGPVRDALVGARMLRPARSVGIVASTQDVALAAVVGGAPSGTIVVADEQRAGRGRAGRRWDDVPEGGSLALTIVLDVPASRTGLVPHALGVAVVTAIGGSGGPAVRLKWPNDAIVRDAAGPTQGRPRKLAGTLVEREQVGERAVLLAGIGLNVDHRSSPAADDRTCLAALLGHDPDRAALLAALLTELDAALVALAQRPDDLLDRYRTVCDTIGREVVVELPGGRRVEGRVEDIDAEGRLLLRTTTSRETILAGTVRDAPHRSVVSDEEERT